MVEYQILHIEANGKANWYAICWSNDMFHYRTDTFQEMYSLMKDYGHFNSPFVLNIDYTEAPPLVIRTEEELAMALLTL